MFVYQSGVSCNQNYVFSAVLMSSGSCSWIVEEEDSAAARVRMLLFQVFLQEPCRAVGAEGRCTGPWAEGDRECLSHVVLRLSWEQAGMS